MHFKKHTGPYPSAYEAAKGPHNQFDTPQYNSPSYRLAFQDPDFLLWDELRPTRMMLELLKPELILQDYGIQSTIVFFGSARIPDQETAQQAVTELENMITSDPENQDLYKRLHTAQKRLANIRYYEESRKLARIISRNTAENTMLIITGGGPGVMEAANRGAWDGMARSIGLNIVLPHEQAPNTYISPELSFQFHYFGTRKMHFMMRAKGLIAFPGGFGTLDEIFEVLTLLQTGKISPIPVILFGSDFWKRVVDFEALVEEGTIDEEDLHLFQYVETADEAWEILASWNGLD